MWFGEEIYSSTSADPVNWLSCFLVTGMPFITDNRFDPNLGRNMVQPGTNRIFEVSMSILRTVFTFVTALLIAGCVSAPLRGELPEGATVTRISEMLPGAPFAVDPAGKLLAVARTGLEIVDLSTATPVLVNPDSPQALAWSKDGERLAAAFCGADACRVSVYDPKGVLLGGTTLAGKVGSFVWRNSSELLISVSELKPYSFGVDYAQKLYRWDLVKAPSGDILHNTTIYGAAGRKRAPSAHKLFTLALSPYGDSVLYPRLYEPPEFPPYLKVFERHLGSGADHEVAKAGIDSPSPVYAASPDSFWSGDGAGRLILYDIWHDKWLDSLPTAGRQLSIAPGGRNLLADGILYRDGKVLVSFLPDVSGMFAADGTRLFIGSGSGIFLVDGLPADPSSLMTGDNRDQLLKLRKWRSEGLITPEEFRRSLERMRTP